MKNKFFVTFLCILALASAVFADANWYDGKKLKNFEVQGIKNLDATKIYDVVSPYIDKEFNKSVYSDIESEIYTIEGVDFVTANVVDNVSPSGVKLIINVKELPKISSISYVGNEKVKAYELTESLTNIKIGGYFDFSKKAQIDLAINDLKGVFLTKGFDDTPVDLSYTFDEKKNTVSLVFTVQEGEQTRITSFKFTGNNNVSESAIKKLLTSKTKSLFNNGYLDYEKLNTDKMAIASYYSTIGYIDAQVVDLLITENTELSNSKYKAVTVTFVIDEGKCWNYGGIKVSGNSIYSDSEINELLTLKTGVTVNLADIQQEINKVTDLYYDHGYISNQIQVDEDRDESSNSIIYLINIIEGPIAYIEDVEINGLTKTKAYVMERELELHPGDVFSKSKLITSAQNLYNTGLLTNLDYDINYGSKENNIIVDFEVEEGNQMDIQFGATFGGTVNGFPISGFLQWADHNFGGRGQDLNVSTNISPDAQSISLSFGDDWFRNFRWSNNVSFSFSHTKYTDQLQKATGSEENVPFYNGRNQLETYPLGTTYETWLAGAKPSAKDLMDYDLLTASLSYQTGYTFIYDVGRLSVSSGLSISLNKALFDSCYVPFEDLIKKYGEKWQFSNSLFASLTWDGRDFIYSPTKGYVLSASVTYAGGILGGLSNYIRANASAAAYFKVLSVGPEDGDQKNLMLCASTDANIMLKQFYNYNKKGWKFYDPRLGATEYEMLYIDGMTNARGHDPNTDNVFLWDNMLELGYPLVENVLQAEAFVSGTALVHDYESFKLGLDWYLSAGAGIKLKISGFPLGFYIVKNATMNKTNGFNFMGGSVFHNDSNPNSGMKFVLAISTSLI